MAFPFRRLSCKYLSKCRLPLSFFRFPLFATILLLLSSPNYRTFSRPYIEYDMFLKICIFLIKESFLNIKNRDHINLFRTTSVSLLSKAAVINLSVINLILVFFEILYNINSFQNVIVLESKRAYVCYNMVTFFVRFFKPK